MFRSFFIAGFECSTGQNVHGEWIDQVAATQHDKYVDHDYQLLRNAGIFAAREAVRWPLVDQNGRYDFHSVEPFIEASTKHQIEIIWDLFHFGYPSDLNPFSDAFPERFAAYCAATAAFIADRTETTCYFTPVNEPSFLAWAAGDMGRFAPHCKGCSKLLKTALIRAAICGIDAIRSVVPSARIVNVDPLCHVVPQPGQPDAVDQAHHFNESVVFESWDMLSGRRMPELGGSPKHLDIVGINYYWTNQWELGRDECPLAEDDPRRLPLRKLVRNVFDRYGCELLISETSHVGDMRPHWLQTVIHESDSLLKQGVPLRGVCLYPILGMPEWHAQHEWVQMGLWDLVPKNGRLTRRLFKPMYEVLRASQERHRTVHPVNGHQLPSERFHDLEKSL